MSKIPNGHEIISLFESMYPKHLAMEGDKIGLQIGALNKPVQRRIDCVRCNGRSCG